MLDVALSADLGSSGLATYLGTWEQLAGRPIDPWLAATGHAWATVLSCGMFVGAVAERAGPEAAATMLEHAEAALQRLGQRLTA